MLKTISPANLSGNVTVPSSKSINHRAIIAASLTSGTSHLSNVSLSDDIRATIGAMEQLGADIRIDGSNLEIQGIPATSFLSHSEEEIVIDCAESGSTLRFLIPILCLFPRKFRLLGRGKLLERPLTPFEPILAANRIGFDFGSEAILIDASQDQLVAGHYHLPGNVSSQFLTGLLFALPLIVGDSKITIDGPLESVGYIDLTLQTLAEFGIEIEHVNYQEYRIEGSQSYSAKDCSIEGDYSQAAFFLVANYLGHDLTLLGLRENSLQGDRAIIDFLRKLDEAVEDGQSLVIDGSQCPDIIPVFTLAACFAKVPVHIVNVERLRIKECDRLAATVLELNSLGANLVEHEDWIEVHPIDHLIGGVTVSSHNDHRMAMMLAIAGSICQKNISITQAESVSKSFPHFWEVYQEIGGIAQ